VGGGGASVLGVVCGKKLLLFQLLSQVIELGNPWRAWVGGLVACSARPSSFALTNHNTSAHMALPTTAALEEDANWAVERATALPEVWALVAENGDGLVDAWRLMSVCTASRTGVRGFLSTLPGLVICGGSSSGGPGRVRDVWRLDLSTLRWEPMPDIVTARRGHACCAVRGTLVVLGGRTSGEEDRPISSEVEVLSLGAFVDLPPLSRGAIYGAAVIEVDESDSDAGQVLLLGGFDANNFLSTVHLVDLATGACARQPDLLHPRVDHAAARMPDGRIICAGGYDDAARLSSVEV
jgi:hypothetical protein